MVTERGEDCGVWPVQQSPHSYARTSRNRVHAAPFTEARLEVP